MEATNSKLVRDYLGNLVPKNKARSILGKYYVEGESCFKMEDGQWYRVTSSDKIAYDHYNKKWVLVESTKLMKGIVNEKGEEGMFIENDFIVFLRNKGDRKNIIGNIICINEKVAEQLGYIECIGDGLFYLKSTITEDDKLTWFNKKNIPNAERSKNYNLEADPERKKELQEIYENYSPKISAVSKRIAKIVGNFTFGMEAEVIDGYLPRRVKSKLGIKALKDGSLRHDNGEGMELVTMPMSGAKGVEVIREFCKELSNRCEVNNLCSVHFHFGNVRKDKLYVLSLYHLITLIQPELTTYFPFSRFNSVKADGKVYCKHLENLGINNERILTSKTEEEFKVIVVDEFNKIYKWLNNGKGLAEPYGNPTITRETVVIDGKKMFYDKWLNTIFTTKSINHAVTGNKWDKPSRYTIFNFLNLFFSNIGTIEARAHEGSTNSTKCLIWLMICASILRYAEDIKRSFELKPGKICLQDILSENMSKSYVDYIMAYLDLRKCTFFTKDGAYRSSVKSIEQKWFNDDPKFNFKYNNIEIK